MNAIRCHRSDDVAVVLQTLEPGDEIVIDDDVRPEDGRPLVAAERIPQLHKVAIRVIGQGEPVKRYGRTIGRATQAIEPGQWVHLHNIESQLASVIDRREMESRIEQMRDDPLSVGSIEVTPPARNRFAGYVRPDGRVGTRNEIWILPLVGCVNRTAEQLACAVRPTLPETVDAVRVWSHPYGCSQLGEDHEATRTILARLARHPNAAGVLLLGLGCENNTLESFLPLLGTDCDDLPIRALVCQEVEDELTEGRRILDSLIEQASAAKRESVSIDRLTVGLKCGGSDALSGVTANPLLGRISDRLVAARGRVILTETPEMFGAEEGLLRRSASAEIFDRSLEMLQGFRDHFTQHGQPVGENPSPGNQEGGITTLEEKSLGCVMKGGDGPVVDVLPYGGQIPSNVDRPGVVLLDGPGNDMVAVTALAAAGAQIVLFTTGRGTPLGGPVPTLKIASGSDLARQKRHWIDFDAGRALADRTLDELADELIDLLLDTAEGVPARNETTGHSEIAIWRRGVTL